jgi:5-methyltetrahydropteroyltriglutamate--homocysteine methyltransferase
MEPLLRTTVVGSYGLPPWLWAAKEQVRAGAFGERDLEETLDDAVRMAIRDQEEAGVDLITDGEMRREHFTLSFYERLGAVRRDPPQRKAGPPGYDTMPVYSLEGRVEAPQGLGIREEFRQAKPLASKPLKVTCPGPLTLLPRLPPVGGERKGEVLGVAREVAAVINRELKGLVEDGAQWIQVDEPALTRVTSEEPLLYPTSPSFRIEPAEAVSLLNEALVRLEAAH